MKNILEKDVKHEMLQRIDKLTPKHERKWGTMNHAQALRHMAMAFQVPLSELHPKRVINMKLPKPLMKFLLLNMKPPKSRAQTFAEINMVKLGINPPDFEGEKRNLKNYVERFSNTDKYIPENLYGGKFTRDDWGKLMYNHTDHHLRQFGV
jgi:hypothetical protein